MKCAEATQEIPNYCYGEISSEKEEALESHVVDCENCRTELSRHRKFLELLEERESLSESGVDAGVLVQCRNDLSRALRQEIAVEATHGRGWRGWHRAMEHLRDLSRVNIPFRVPVGAMALVALGFVGARYTPEKFGGVRAAVAAPMFSSVRSIEPDASGQVQIAVDETRRHVVSGALQDPQIQELLLSGVTDGSNPNVRLQSIQVLHQASSQNTADSDEVKQALVGALQHDPSAGVRLKALEGLKQFSGDVSVRAALANVLQKDDDPTVRAQAIGLLAAHTDDSLVGVLQNVVQKEDNEYVRAQIAQLLAQLKASVGTYSWGRVDNIVIKMERLEMFWKKTGLVCIVLAALAIVGYAQTTKAPRGRSANIQANLQGSGYLGVGVVGVQDAVQVLSPDRVKSLGLKDNAGVLITDVQEGEAGAKAGIHKFDVILEINGQKVDNSQEFQATILTKAPGTKVNLTVWRGGSRQNIAAMLGTRPPDAPLNALPMGMSEPGPISPEQMQMMMAAAGAVGAPKVGFDCVEMLPQLAAYFGVSEGVLVESVSPGTPAERAGLKAGDVITKVNGLPVTTAREIFGIIRQASKKTVAFTVVRNKKPMALNIELAWNRPDQSDRDLIN